MFCLIAPADIKLTAYKEKNAEQLTEKSSHFVAIPSITFLKKNLISRLAFPSIVPVDYIDPSLYLLMEKCYLVLYLFICFA